MLHMCIRCLRSLFYKHRHVMHLITQRGNGVKRSECSSMHLVLVAYMVGSHYIVQVDH